MAVSFLDFPVLWNPKETSEKLRVTEQTLAKWRSTKKYSLKFFRSGRRIFYNAADVLEFIASRTGTETSPVRQPREHAHKAGLAAMHIRWHVNRGVVNPKCPLCQQVPQ
jgi:hypothetical protein